MPWIITYKSKGEVKEGILLGPGDSIRGINAFWVRNGDGAFQFVSDSEIIDSEYITDLSIQEGFKSDTLFARMDNPDCAVTKTATVISSPEIYSSEEEDKEKERDELENQVSEKVFGKRKAFLNAFEINELNKTMGNQELVEKLLTPAKV